MTTNYVDGWVSLGHICLKLLNSLEQILEYISSPIPILYLADITQCGPEVYGYVIVLSSGGKHMTDYKNNKSNFETVLLYLRG